MAAICRSCGGIEHVLASCETCGALVCKKCKLRIGCKICGGEKLF